MTKLHLCRTLSFNPLLINFFERNLALLASVSLHFNRFEDLFDIIIILVVELSAHVDLIVAKTYEFTFHSVDALQRVKVQSVAIIDVPETNVFPELTGQENGGEHQRPPIGEAYFDFGSGH